MVYSTPNSYKATHSAMKKSGLITREIASLERGIYYYLTTNVSK